MAFPQVASEATTSDTTQGATSSLNLPSGIEVGDLLICKAVVGRGNAGGPISISMSGWTELLDQNVSGGVYLWIGWRIATGSDAATLEFSGWTADCAATITRYTGHGADVNPPEISAVTGASNTSPNTLSLTPSWGARDTLWESVVGVSDDVSASAYPANYTGTSQPHNSGGADGSLLIARRERNIATEDPGAFTLPTSEFWDGVTMAIPPEPFDIVERSASASASASVSALGTVIPTIEGAAAITASAEVLVEGTVSPAVERPAALSAASDIITSGSSRPVINSAAVFAAGTGVGSDGEVAPGHESASDVSASAVVSSAGEWVDAHLRLSDFISASAISALSHQLDLRRSASAEASTAVSSSGSIAIPFPDWGEPPRSTIAAEFDIEAGIAGFAVFGSASAPESGATFANDASVGTVAWSNVSNAGAEDGAVASAVLGTTVEVTENQFQTVNTSIQRYAGQGWNDPSFGPYWWSGLPGGPTAIGSPSGTGAGWTGGYAGTSHYLMTNSFGFSFPSGASIKGILLSVLASGVGATDYEIRLHSNGFRGSNKAISAWGGPGYSWRGYGGSGDTWGTSWSTSQVTTAAFGAAVRVSLANTSSAAAVDAVAIDVFYSYQQLIGTITHIETNPKTSQYLKVTDFGINVPVDATITGIKAVIREKCTLDPGPEGTQGPQDNSIKIVKGNTIQGNEKAKPGSWPTDFIDREYGGAGDKWGLTWTPADVNASDFGIAISAKHLGTAQIDDVQLIVYYTLPGEEVQTVGQPSLRFSPEEVDAGRVVLAANFSTEMPGLFSAGTLSLSRPEFFDPQDYLFANARVFEFESDQTLYEGRVVGVSESESGVVTVELEGWARHLGDNKTARALIYDRDLSAWEGMSVQQKIVLLGSGFGVEDGGAAPDASTGSPAVELGFDGAWTTPKVAQAWYNSENLPISFIDYAWKRSSTVASSGSNFRWRVGGSSDDIESSTNVTANLQAAGPGSGTVTTTSGDKVFAFVDFANTAAGGTDGTRYSVFFTLLGIVGDHGIPLQGSVAAPADGRGVYLSDVAEWIIETWAPLLDIGDVEATDFVIPHAVFKEPTSALDMLEALVIYGSNSDYPMDWWVDEGRTFRMASPENHGTVWRTRYTEGATADGSGPDVQRMINGVMVTYDDGTGRKRSVGPPNSQADVETELLIDLSDSNPANRDGAQHWEIFDAGITSQAGATLIGQLVLAERNRQEWRGSVRIQGRVRDSAANLHPVSLVRAGDFLIIEDDEDTRPRRIVNTDYDSSNQSTSCSIGAPPDRLDILLARAGVVLVGRI